MTSDFLDHPSVYVCQVSPGDSVYICKVLPVVYMYLRSHLVTVATGPRLSDALISSPIIVEDGAVPGAGFEFGIDPNEDPELALVSSGICSSLPMNVHSVVLDCYNKTTSQCFLRRVISVACCRASYQQLC